MVSGVPPGGLDADDPAQTYHTFEYNGRFTSPWYGIA